MGKFVPKTYDQILQRMADRLVARSSLSDVDDKAQVKAALSAFARELADAHYQTRNLLDLFSLDRAEGDDLDERIEDFPIELARKLAVAAVGSLVFSRNVSGPIVVPTGTLVEVPGADPAIVAVTTAPVNVVGTTSGNVPAVIQTAGEIGNVAIDALTKFKGLRPSGVDAVTNPSPFSGGLDKESDDALRARVRAYIATLSRGTPLALVTAALGVELATGQRIIFARCVEDNVILGKSVLYVDDGSGSVEETADNYGSPELLTTGPDFPGDVAVGGETILYTTRIPVKDSLTFTLEVAGAPQVHGVDYTLNPASGKIVLTTPLAPGDDATFESTAITGIMAEVQKVIDGDLDDTVNYPGFRAAGTLVLVKAPTTQTVTIVANIVVLDGFDVTEVAAAVSTAIASYVNGLGIGNDVVKSEMVERAMSIEGMYDISIVTPATNVPILEDVLPRTSSSNITLT